MMIEWEDGKMGRWLDRRAAARPGFCRSTKSSRTCGAALTQLSPRGIHRCLRWHGLSARLAPQKARVVTFQTRRSGRDIDLKYLPPLNRQRSYAYVAIDRATRFVYLEILPDRRAPTAAGFLARFPLEVYTILTDDGSEFTDRFAVDKKGKPQDKPSDDRPFDRICGGGRLNLEVYLSCAGRSDRRIAPLRVLSTPTRRRWNRNSLEMSHMASWLVKAMVQRSIGALPNPYFWNGLLQDWVTHSTRLTDEVFFENLRNCGLHLANLQRYNSTTLGGFAAFELGTGWFPVVPIGLFLCGAREVWTWDIAPLLKLDRLKGVIARVLELEQKQLLKSHLDALPERLALLKEVMTRCDSRQRHEPAQLLEQLNIHYRIGNASRSELPPASIDLIVSDVVFEHPSSAELSEILHEFRRISVPKAVMSHSIALDDQYSGRDSRITQFNFLRFSDRMWRWIDNPIIPLNRLRISDYRRLFSEGGFQIVEEISRRGDPAELARVPLAERFRGYPIEDLLVTYARLVATPRNS